MWSCWNMELKLNSLGKRRTRRSMKRKRSSTSFTKKRGSTAGSAVKEEQCTKWLNTSRARSGVRRGCSTSNRSRAKLSQERPWKSSIKFMSFWSGRSCICQETQKGQRSIKAWLKPKWALPFSFMVNNLNSIAPTWPGFAVFFGFWGKTTKAW